MSSDESFASVIHVNVALLRLSGVVSCGGKATDVRRARILQTVLGTVAYGCLLTYSLLYTREFILYTVHLGTWMESLAMILSVMGGQARFTIILLSQRRFRRLLTVCEELWLTLSAREKGRVRDCMKGTRRLTYYYVFGCVFTIFFYAVANLFMKSRHDDSPANISRSLPYVCPIDVHRTPYYEITYAMQLCSMTNVGLTCAATDTIGPVLILTVSGHFKVLNSRIQRICERTCDKEGKSREDATVFLEDTSRSDHAMLDLKACVRYHQTILAFCKEVEKLTTGIFLSQLLTSTYNISLVGFKLAGDDPDKFKYTTQVLIAAIQLFLSNWPADVLLTESNAVAKAAYFTSWYRSPYRLKKSLHIITMRSQKAEQLTAGYFVPLSLQTFASMVSSAASFFTMMRSMN
ncbi:PREDICTED: putative odorant receptor 85d [Dinoponera quadriceps]|uniref:Odorant receptor n=1 Tax=Dinoponera quadriceps TaxID=609295 RepID=A0A6P3XTS7_DINQU|nr:PREDICTED: putative odorant receptor 85d [Dinoponera quadriceps]